MTDEPVTASAATLRGRAISVRQPWAWAIVHGGKDVENRGRRDPWRTALGERIWVHAAKTPEPHDYGAVRALAGAAPAEPLVLGALIGSVVVRDLHHADRCGSSHGWSRFCSPWAQPGQWHIVVAAPVALPQPIPFRGALGLFALEALGV